MISLPFRRLRRSPNIAALYGAIVAQARLPAFYRGYGVPDTVEGRLDMILLHLVLALRALGRDRATPPGLGQELFDHFCRDMDGNLREMGIGDLSVPKHMQRVAEAFYGRTKVYESALDGAGAGTLEAAVARNVFGTAEPAVGARRLAAYMREADARLTGADLDFPDPEAIAPP